MTFLIENTQPEYWEKSIPPILLEKCNKFVRRLRIQQLLPNRKIAKKSFGHVQNFPSNVCNHGSLKILSALTNLIELNIQFGVKKIGANYHRRFFTFSDLDVKNLADGLNQLPNLNIFRLTFSKMTEEKVKILLQGMLRSPIHVLEISYCELEDICAMSIGGFLNTNITLKEIELKGNLFGPEGCKAIGTGIRNFQGSLDYLGLAGNPLHEDGVIAIGVGIFQTNHVKRLNLMGCNVNEEAGGFRVSQLIGSHLILEELSMDCIPLNEICAAKIIEGLVKNKNLCRLGIRGCNLTKVNEMKIQRLVERNNFYKSNPCLDKPEFFEEDVEEIDMWINSIKYIF